MKEVPEFMLEKVILVLKLARQMIRIVSDFIDSLETVTISQEKIDEFKEKSDAVE